MSTVRNELGEERISRLLVRYGIPAVASSLVSALYNFIDQIFIGNRIGYLGNAATTVAFPLTILCGATALLFGIGASVLFNIMQGKGNKDAAMQNAGSGITFLAIAAAVIGIVVSVLVHPLVYALGATQSVAPYAITYIRIIAIGMPFTIFATGAGLLIRSDGSPRYSMAVTLTGVGINVVLDYLFLYPLSMGIAGAALATVIGQMVSFAMVVWYLLHFKCNRFTRAHLRVSGRAFRSITAIGAAAAVNQAAMMVMQIVLNNSLKYYGDLSAFGGSEVLAAAGVVAKINMLFYCVMIGFSVGGEPIVGFSYGAGKYDRVKEVYWKTILIAISVGLVETLCFWLFPAELAALFGSGENGYQEFVVLYMHTFMLLVIISGVPPVSMNLLSSIGKPKTGMIISLSKQLTLIVLLLILPVFFGLNGVLASGPAADIIAGAGAALIIRKTFRAMEQMGGTQ